MSADGPGDQPPANEPGESSTSRAVRGPDTVQRIRRTYKDQSIGTATLPDWTRFNIQLSLKRLRSWEPSVIQKELRKLHLRWWHASEPKMRQILSAVGIDNARLDMIKPIVDTCRECRAWQRPGNTVVASVSLPTRFNEEGECDLMFYKNYIAFHIIDRAIKLSDGEQIHDKSTNTLLDAYTSAWVQRHGPVAILFSGGESGLNNDAARAQLKRLGTDLLIKAKGQHASTVESRIAMLRHVMHLIEEDCKRHGNFSYAMRSPFTTAFHP